MPCRPCRASEPYEFIDTAGKVSGFSLHAGVAARADERGKLECLCRHISRAAVSERRLSLTPGVNESMPAPRIERETC